MPLLLLVIQAIALHLRQPDDKRYNKYEESQGRCIAHLVILKPYFVQICSQSLRRISRPTVRSYKYFVLSP